jgi:hypothetical protein
MNYDNVGTSDCGGMPETVFLVVVVLVALLTLILVFRS